MPAVVETIDLTKLYRRRSILRAVNLTVEPGEIVGVIGPHGCGKSTLLRTLVDVVRPSSGTLRVLGKSPRSGSARVRRRIGYLPSLQPFGVGTVGGALRRAARLLKADVAGFTGVARLLDLDPSRRTDTLTPQQCQKLSFALALGHGPDLLILDEPSIDLDPVARGEVVSLIVKARSMGTTVICAGHLLTDIDDLAERIVILRAGEVVIDSSLEQLRTALPSVATVSFVGPAPVDELASVADDVSISGRTATLTVDDPNELLGVLARHEVMTIAIERPDLAGAIVGLYGDEEPAPGSAHVIGDKA